MLLQDRKPREGVLVVELKSFSFFGFAAAMSASHSYCLISLTFALSAAACALSYVFLRESGEGSGARFSSPDEVLDPELIVQFHTVIHRQQQQKKG